MRVLFCCAAADGHFLPLLPLARALARSGHDIAFATAARYGPRVADAGFEALPTGVGVDEIEQRMLAHRAAMEKIPPHERRPYAFAFRFATLDAPAKLDDLLREATRWRPDLVVHETADLAAPPVAASLGVPSANHSFGRLLPEACLERAAPLTAELWQRLGLEPEPWSGLYRGPYVDICPPSLQDAFPPDGTRVLHLRPAASTPGDPAWQRRLVRERPVVYVTLGTVFNDKARFGTILSALSALDATILATIGRNNDPAAFAHLPDNLIVERYVPQADVLPFCDVAVGHAGSGSMLGALAHGLPMLLLPHGADQFENAQACAVRGAATVLMPAALTAEDVASAVASLLEDRGARAAAERIGRDIAAMPTADDVAVALT
jgi:UDP:flavonoid glycosyltransferase YjiC (YdhE family)